MRKLVWVASVFMTVTSFARRGQCYENGEFGGFVSDEEKRFKGYVWEFIEELDRDCKMWWNFCADFQNSWIDNEYKKTFYVYGSDATSSRKMQTSI